MRFQNRVLHASVFAGLAALGIFVTQSDAKMEALEKVADGVWFREGDLMGKGHCNNVIIEMKDYLVVVDANFPSGAQAALADIKKVSPKPVRYVFDTHHHGDHAYGNPVWTKIGATTVAHKGVVDEMNRYEPKRWQAASKERKDVGELKLNDVERPKQTFDAKPFVIEDGTRRVELHHLGWAHTRGDGFAYLPKEGILCTGDAATNGPYNYTADANIANWPSVMEKALALNPKKVLPGHGPAGDAGVLKGEMAFMKELRAAVQAQVKAGKKVGDVVTMKDGKPSSSSLKLSDGVKHWVGPFYAQQVADAFEEITAGKPHGDLPH